MLLTSPFDGVSHPCYTAPMASSAQPPDVPVRSQFPSLRRVLSWFVPGLGIKRWILMILAGVTLLGLGLGMLVLDLYRTDSTDPVVLTALSYASLRFLPRLVRVLVFGGLGIGFVTYGIWRLNRALLRPFMR